MNFFPFEGVILNLTTRQNLLSNLDQYFNIDQMMAENELILAYRDHISDATVQQLLAITELKLVQSGEEKKLRKRIFNVLVECLQNIVNHGASDKTETEVTSLLLIGRHGNEFFIITGNKIENGNIESFRDKVERINAMEHHEMREIYSDALDKSQYSEKGGAGLGLLDIYKRSGNKLIYQIDPIDDRICFLSIHIRVKGDEQ